jgi:hypothetical protein
MLVTIDKIASRYHLLPSEVMSRGSTFDLECMDLGIRYTVIEEQKRNGTYKKPIPKLTEKEMLNIIKKTKNGKGKQKQV